LATGKTEILASIAPHIDRDTLIEQSVRVVKLAMKLAVEILKWYISDTSADFIVSRAIIVGVDLFLVFTLNLAILFDQKSYSHQNAYDLLLLLKILNSISHHATNLNFTATSINKINVEMLL